MSEIGNRMRELRGASSQREMAEAIGIKYNAWARYEAGDVLPGAEIITRICRVHACSADWLLGIDRGTSAAVVVNGSGNAVANGAHARASVVLGNAGETPICKKCKYLKAIKKLQKAGLQLPDDM